MLGNISISHALNTAVSVFGFGSLCELCHLFTQRFHSAGMSWLLVMSPCHSLARSVTPDGTVLNPGCVDFSKADGIRINPFAATSAWPNLCCSWSRRKSRKGIPTDRRKYSSGVSAGGLSLRVCLLHCRGASRESPASAAKSVACRNQSANVASMKSRNPCKQDITFRISAYALVMSFVFFCNCTVGHLM